MVSISISISTSYFGGNLCCPSNSLINENLAVKQNSCGHYFSHCGLRPLLGGLYAFQGIDTKRKNNNDYI